MKQEKVVFIADFYKDIVAGGAELYTDVIFEELKDSCEIIKITSNETNKKFLKKYNKCLFVISNFILLGEDCKKYICDNMRYVIIEHDHKYLRNNNPVHYKKCLAPPDEIQNMEFYQKAVAVFCQSKLHCEIIYKNTLLKNLINLGGNLWSKEHISILSKYIDSQKSPLCAILESVNKNKGMIKAIDYCRNTSQQFRLIPSLDYEIFIKTLSSFKKLVFFPLWIESFSRLAIEAKILGCELVTNGRLGCASEGLLNLSGKKLLDRVIQDQERIITTFKNLILNNKIPNYYEKKLPKISIMTTFVDGEKYIKGWLKSCEQQTIFNEIDIYICDAGSTGNEQKIIKNFMKKHKNVFYTKKNNKISASEAFNEMMKESPNEYISLVPLDDRLAKDYSEILRKYLFFSETDLVYGDCFQTMKPNETFCSNSSHGRRYEHSLKDFSRENMIKCLPGPIPMFKKQTIVKSGGFDIILKHVNDWEVWLRCIRNGAEFFKVHAPVGLYYFSPTGVTTSKKNEASKRREEKKVFYEYRDVIGEENFQIFKNYFDEY